MTDSERIERLERVAAGLLEELSLARQALQSHAAAIKILAENAGATFEERPAQVAPLASFN